MSGAYIVGAVRTAVGGFGGGLKDVGAATLGACVVREALARAGIPPEAVGETIMGNVLQAGQGMNPARQAAIGAGIPVEIPAFTVNMVCGSGLKAVALAAGAVLSGEAEIAAAGGMENMSRSPYLVPGARWGMKSGNGTLVDSMVTDGLWDAFNNYHMGITAENIAGRFGITRAEQDAHAFESHMRAARAAESGHFRDEIVPVSVPGKKGGTNVFDADEHIRPDATAEKLAMLRPVFRDSGTVTAGNSSGLNDGAAAVIVASGRALERLSLEPLARIVSWAAVGLDPASMGLGPVGAARAALGKAGLTIEDIDLFEVNEAFSAQYLASARELGLPSDRTNVNGGAVALGHPLGCTGAKLTTTALHELKRRGGKYALVTMCIGTGMGAAGIFEAI